VEETSGFYSNHTWRRGRVKAKEKPKTKNKKIKKFKLIFLMSCTV
jgi:hypothetical protein